MIASRLTHLLAKSVVRVQPKYSPLSTSAIRLASGNPNLELGVYPRTEEERLRAAKKYNLIPEDYEPYPEEEGFGDYPNLKPIGAYNKDKYLDYDDPFDYRHYGEVCHRDYEMLLWERADTQQNEKINYPFYIKFLTVVAYVSALPILYYTFNRYKIQINHRYKVRKHQNVEPYEFKDMPPVPHH